MQCRDVERELSAYLDGESTPDDMRRVETHLDTCAVCRDLASRLSGARDAFRALQPEPASKPLLDELAAAAAATRRPRRHPIVWLAPLAAAAALGWLLFTPEHAPVSPQGVPVFTGPASGPEVYGAAITARGLDSESAASEMPFGMACGNEVNGIGSEGIAGHGGGIPD